MNPPNKKPPGARATPQPFKPPAGKALRFKKSFGAYRPLPIPKVLQTKNVVNRKSSSETRPIAPPAYRPQPIPRVLQTKQATALAVPTKARDAARLPAKHFTAARPSPTIQRMLNHPNKGAILPTTGVLLHQTIERARDLIQTADDQLNPTQIAQIISHPQSVVVRYRALDNLNELLQDDTNALTQGIVAARGPVGLTMARNLVEFAMTTSEEVTSERPGLVGLRDALEQEVGKVVRRIRDGELPSEEVGTIIGDLTLGITRLETRLQAYTSAVNQTRQGQLDVNQIVNLIYGFYSQGRQIQQLVQQLVQQLGGLGASSGSGN